MQLTTGYEAGSQAFAFARAIYAVAIAMLPIIRIYNFPVVNMGLSSLLLVLFAAYAVLFYPLRKKYLSLAPFYALFAYLLIGTKGDWFNTFLLAIVMVHVFGAIGNSVDVSIVRRVIEAMAVLGTAFILLQTFSYYVLGQRVVLLQKGMVLEDLYYYFEETADNLYRPSAFFLEPSHYSQYCSIALLSALFPAFGRKANLRKAAWITLGCLLTTSGIGIVVVTSIWALFGLLGRKFDKGTLLTLLTTGGALTILLIVMMQFNFFSLAVQRVFGEVDGYNAIWGRTLYWDLYIGRMGGIELLIGKGTGAMPDVYMTGLMEVIYSYGYVGVVLLGLFFAYIAVKSRDAFTVVSCLVFCALFLVASTFNFIMLTFWLCLLVGSTMNRKKWYATRIT